MNILMVAYFFPPESSSGSFRPLHFARHLEESGENITVLSVREEDYWAYQPKDHQLLDQISANVEVFRTRMSHPKEAIINFRNWLLRKTPGEPEKKVAISQESEIAEDQPDTSWFQNLKDTITDLLTTPDTAVGWLPSAVRAGRKIVKAKDIDVIYATGGPWTALLIGIILKKLTGTPLVLDFRDPWVSNYEFRFKQKTIRSLSSWMERKVLATADHIVTNTEALKQDFIHRYSFLSPDTLTTIPNGFEDYIESHESKSTTLTLTHAGILILRNPRRLFKAALNLIENKVIPKEEIRFVLLGGFFIDDPALDALLQHPLLENVVEILPRLPYQEALQYQHHSDVLFLIQPDIFPLQVPRKLYEYIALRKPILGITDPNGATAHVIQENDAGIVVPDQTSDLESALQTFYEQWKAGTLKPISPKKGDTFKNLNLTKKLRTVLRKCVESHQG
jgi:glycosyltransferase involved in cell wall biosynthesis